MIAIQIFLFLTVGYSNGLLLENFIHKQFKNEPITIISSNFQNWNNNLKYLFQQNLSKIIANGQVSDITSFENYIIVESDLDNLILTIEQIYYNFNTRAKNLIIFDKNYTSDELKHIFLTLWSYYIYNVVIFVNHIDFITWYPYKKSNKCGTVVNIVINAKFPFNKKIPKKVHKCPVNVTWTVINYAIFNPFDENNPGYIIKCLNTVGEKLNLDLVYLTENINYLALGVQTGDWSYLIKDMKHRRIDLAPLIENMVLEYKEIERTKPFYHYTQHFVLPPRQIIRNSWKIFEIFSLQIWSTIIISVIVMSVFSKKPFEIVQLTIQCVIPKMPRNFFPRLTFIIFLLGICNLNWLYLSKLSSVLTKPSYESKIRNIADLVKSDKKLLFFAFYDESLRFFGNETYQNLMNRKLKKSDWLEPSVKILHDFVKNLNYGIILGDAELFAFQNPEVLQVLRQENVTNFI